MHLQRPFPTYGLVHIFWVDTSFGAIIQPIESENHSVMTNSLRLHGLQPARLLCPWNSPGQNTGVGRHSLLQGIFPTQGSNLGLLHCGQIPYHLSHQGSQLSVYKILLILGDHQGPV